jgi:hypothetical protein
MQMHRANRTFRLSLAAAFLVVAAALAAGSARAGTAYVYTDAGGDSKSAPDITKVTATDGGDGTVSFAIDLASGGDLADGRLVVLSIDADRNHGTGDSMGGEFVVAAGTGGLLLLHWQGQDYAPADHHPMNPTLGGGRLTFTLTLADVGVSAFDFAVVGIHGNDDDVAPESGSFSYPQAAPAPQISGVVIPATALFPKAGKVFRVSGIQVRLASNEIVAADSVSCSLAYRGAMLKSARPCAWLIPKQYRKKLLTLTLTVSYGGATKTITLPVRPR